jgi:hypothetical protein
MEFIFSGKEREMGFKDEYEEPFAKLQNRYWTPYENQ